MQWVNSSFVLIDLETRWNHWNLLMQKHLHLIALLILLLTSACVQIVTPEAATLPAAMPDDAAATIPTLPAAPADRQTVEPGPTPVVGNVPLADAPGDLASVDLPSSEDEIRALLARLPSEIAGYERTPQFDFTTFERIIIGYGEDARLNPSGAARLQIQAIDATSGDFFPPNWRAEHIVQTLAQGRALEQGQDGELYWAYVETDVTPAGSTQSYTLRSLTWGEQDGEWVFSVSADKREEVEALVAAFVEAAGE